jgi:hypothetical protein
MGLLFKYSALGFSGDKCKFKSGNVMAITHYPLIKTQFIEPVLNYILLCAGALSADYVYNSFLQKSTSQYQSHTTLI